MDKMNNDLIKRSDVEQMLIALGGCDASDKEAEGLRCSSCARK